MRWIIVTVGMNPNYAYGPFENRQDAVAYAARVLQDYRVEVVRLSSAME